MTSLPGLQLITTTSLAVLYNNVTVQQIINNFMEVITEANWNVMNAAFSSASYKTSLGTARVLVTVADGTVAYDSSKSASINTWLNFKDKAINKDNHNTRPEILLALLSTSGTGSADRYSTSVNSVDLNYATRFGLSSTYPLGCYRLSQS
jgi:hypothetical protein